MGYDEPRGVGGWLAFLVISLIALGPLRSVVATFADISSTESVAPALAAAPAWGTAKLLYWLMTALRVGMMIFTGVRLNTELRPATVKLAIGMLWAVGPLMTIVTALVVYLPMGANALTDGGVWLGAGQGAVYALAWTLYLLLSRRVRNTYEEEEPAAPLAQVFE